jgi:NADH-quinone oxidoreductase subunit M
MAPWLTNHLLSWISAAPLVGLVVVAWLRDDELIKKVSLASTLVALVLSLVVWAEFDHAKEGMQFVERAAWMPTFNIQYAVGVDGISLPLLLLTTLLPPLCVLTSWNAIETKVKAFMMLILLVESAMVVVFTALDLFLFFMLWEVTMIPMYFMIVLWGGPQRVPAAVKFVLFSLTGSLLLLIGILGLYLEGGRTFDLLVLAQASFSANTQFWIFLAFFLAFAIKMPMLPFHTWLPDAHSEAPTAGSVILAGILLKMGGYGFLRLCLPLFPQASADFATFILWLSVAAILYGGYNALAQEDIKKMVAYSSISHMGFVTLGIFVFNNQGVHGAILQMFNHGITTGALFLVVGQLYDRTHSREIDDYGGLHKLMPRFTTFLCIFSVASFGLPGTCSFIGEFLVLVGASARSYVMVLLAMGGIVLAASYMLWMLQRVALGPITTRFASSLPDLTIRETVVLAPLATLVFVIGLYPGPFINAMDATVTGLVKEFEAIPR